MDLFDAFGGGYGYNSRIGMLDPFDAGFDDERPRYSSMAPVSARAVAARQRVRWLRDGGPARE